MEINPITAKLPIRDNDSAPTIYGDAMVNVTVTINATITVATLRADYNSDGKPKEAVVSGRLVLPLAALVDLHGQLGNILDTLRQTGQLRMIQTGPMTRQ